ncbi:hypothetical protein ACFPK1_27440 [Actinomycetospora rhizophila]|uniref:Uncharacterized protein n=1 Tax=Actinomycetospora rhizophila TaxID=1416876 RepID=A0ABV9ZKJ9_9PSEU
MRGDIQVALANQVAILSFGTATVGLLVAAAATLWSTSDFLAASLLILIVPVVCFLSLAVYLGEQVRQMRAGLFLDRLECRVNQDAGVMLTWEHWDIRSGMRDVDRHNRWAILAVFGLLALGFTVAGYVRLLSSPWANPTLLMSALAVNVVLGLAAILWSAHLCREGAAYRRAYHLFDNESPTAPRET